MKKIYTTILSLFTVGVSLAQSPNLVTDINPGTGNSSPNNLFVFDGNVYFGADDSTGSLSGGTDVGRELYRYNGTTMATEYITDIRPGSSGSSPFNFFVFEGNLYFTAKSPVTFWFASMSVIS